MNALDWLRGLVSGKKETESFAYTYNYTYFPPIPLVDCFPGTGLYFGWTVRVALVQFRVTLNLLAEVLQEEQPQLLAELDQVEQAFNDHKPLTTLLELCDFFEKLALKKPEILSGFVARFKNIVLKLDGKRGLWGAIKLLLAVGGQLDKKDNNLALDFWLLFEEVQNNLLAEADDVRLSDFDAYKRLFRHLPLPPIAHTWQDDATFADMRVAGPNPETLTRLTTPLEKFPVSDADFKRVMGGHDNLARAMKEGRVYVVDYAVFDGVVPGSYPGPQKYIGAPIAMFAVPADGTDRRLKPVAIQCGQTPGDAFPIITPVGAGEDAGARVKWEMAKTWFQVSDGNYHEAVAHLGRTHLLISPFVIATCNILTEAHPIGKLLLPHFKGTFNINNAAQASLIASEGVIDQIMGGTIDMSRIYGAIGARSYALHFDQSFQPQTFTQREVADVEALPYYPYRDCSLLIWDAIRSWVGEYVYLIYGTETAPEQDAPLQAWYQNLVSHEGGRIAGFGESGALRTRTYLIDALTMIVFTASAGHAAVNFPQREIMSYPPAMPLAAYAPPPTGSGTYTQADLMAMFPPLRQAMIQINTGTLLGGIYYTRLGDLPAGYYEGAAAEAFARFQARLAGLENEMKHRWPEYGYLLPSNIPRSINI